MALRLTVRSVKHSRMRRVLLGLDGSANALRAAEWTASLCSSLGAEVVAVHALGLLHTTESGDLVAADRHRAAIRGELEAWCAPLRDAGIDFTARLCEGEPVSALLDTAEELDADLVVVGTRGAGTAPRSSLGSTSRMLAQQAHRPIVIVPDSA
jgi:nucleotide-binding universal stress UspA family protein